MEVHLRQRARCYLSALLRPPDRVRQPRIILVAYLPTLYHAAQTESCRPYRRVRPPNIVADNPGGGIRSHGEREVRVGGG